MRTAPELRVLLDPAALAHAAAQIVATAAREAIAARGRFTLAISGGSTPRRLFELLALPEWRDQVDWRRVEVFWADDRCVPPAHPDSNYRMAREALLAHVATPPDHIHRMRGEADPHAAADEYEALLRERLGPSGQLDLLLLGMGADGHTASLFPGTAALDEGARWCVANHLPHLNAWRLTLTFAVLNAARRVALLVTGADKAAAVARALSPEPSANPPPAARVRLTSGHLTWLLDQPAAAALD